MLRKTLAEDVNRKEQVSHLERIFDARTKKALCQNAVYLISEGSSF